MAATTGAAIRTEAPLPAGLVVAGKEGAPGPFDVLLGTAVPFPDGPGITPAPVLELSGTEPVGTTDDNLEVTVPTTVPVRTGAVDGIVFFGCQPRLRNAQTPR